MQVFGLVGFLVNASLEPQPRFGSGWLVGWLVNRSSYAVRSNPQTVSNTFAAWSLPVIILGALVR
jgi:hypothetical protein